MMAISWDSWPFWKFVEMPFPRQLKGEPPEEIPAFELAYELEGELRNRVSAVVGVDDHHNFLRVARDVLLGRVAGEPRRRRGAHLHPDLTRQRQQRAQVGPRACSRDCGCPSQAVELSLSNRNPPRAAQLRSPRRSTRSADIRFGGGSNRTDPWLVEVSSGRARWRTPAIACSVSSATADSRTLPTTVASAKRKSPVHNWGWGRVEERQAAQPIQPPVGAQFSKHAPMLRAHHRGCPAVRGHTRGGVQGSGGRTAARIRRRSDPGIPVCNEAWPCAAFGHRDMRPPGKHSRARAPCRAPQRLKLSAASGLGQLGRAAGPFHRSRAAGCDVPFAGTAASAPLSRPMPCMRESIPALVYEK
eukprot:gene624-biopygen1773